MGQFADSNRASMRLLAEDQNGWGITPGSGSPRELRIKTSKLAPKKETKTSDELRSDRMIPNIIEVGASADGDVEFELSAGAMDDLLAAFVYGLWSRPMTMDRFVGKKVSVTANNTVSIAGGDYRRYFTAGRRVKTEGFYTRANNDYFQIASLAYVAGANRTDVVMTGTSLVVENGNDFVALLDANDVFVLKNTALRFGTAGASAIDSNGTNAFAAARAAGQIKIGQKISVSGVGYSTATLTFTGQPVAGSTYTIRTGSKSTTFQFDGVLIAGNVPVGIGADSDATAANLVAAIIKTHVTGDSFITATAAASVVTVTSLYDTTELVVTPGGTTNITSAVALADANLRGVFTVTSVADDAIGVSPAPATFDASTHPVTIKGSMLRNPSKTTDFVRQSFTVETSFEDINQHFVATGLRVGSFDLNVSAGNLVDGTVSFMGRAMERRPDQTSLLRSVAYTPLDATVNEVMNATVNVGDLSKDGTVLSTGIQSIKIKGEASLREQKAVGHKYAVGIGVGRFKLTGSFTAYFETGELFDDFITHKTVALSWFFRDINDNRYDISLPAIKLTSDPISPKGIDQDVIEEIDWEAQRDPATECMLQFDRFSSLKAPTAI